MNPGGHFDAVDHDVVICGGGLAGACLAKQLRDALPGLSVRVYERTPSPLPVSAYKVGESTVEVGAHYLAEVVGLRKHIDSEHLEKLGLRYFYNGTVDGLPGAAEFGVTRFLPAPSYQLDRGVLEETLRGLVQEAGADFLEGVRITDIRLGEGAAPHEVTVQDREGATETVSCRWVIDAMGRRRFLQKQLGLAMAAPHRHSAVWWRLAGRLDIDEVVARSHSAWHARVAEPRWNSTNHFMFEGGWMWVIPLGTGHTSVGIVASEAQHPFATFNTLQKALAFAAERVPELAGPMRALEVLDFLVMRGYSHSSRQVFSGDRWACVGESGVFADPYYSVGSNLIAYANGFTTRMIAQDVEGRFDAGLVTHANRYYLSLAENLTHNIQLAYPFHHRPGIMALKTIWDYYVGWAFSDPQYYEQTYLHPAQSAVISGLGARVVAIQARVMGLFEVWARQGEESSLAFDYIDYIDDLPTLARLFEQSLPRDRVRAFDVVMRHIREGIDRIEELAHVLFYLALDDVLPEEASRVRAAGWLNVSALSLQPDQWEADGLFAPRSRPRMPELAALDTEIRSLFRVLEVV